MKIADSHTAGITISSDRGPSMSGIAPADAVKILAPDGRVLLRIGADGAVEGAVEDAGDAAVVFVSEVRRLIELGALCPSVWPR